MSEKNRLLIVEDEAIPAMMLKQEMEKAGYEVFKPVATGETAVEVARKNRFDLVLMDINLAGRMDGIEAAAQIMSFSDTPIVFVTGFSDETVKQRANALKPAGFLTKPITASVLAALTKKKA